MDNLYFKCQTSGIKISHDYTEYQNQNENKKNKKKTEDKKKNKEKGQVTKEDEENNMELKCQIALQKLKSIFAYTSDYKMMIEDYKKLKK